MALGKRVGDVCSYLCMYVRMGNLRLESWLGLSVGHTAIWFVVITYKVN